MEGYNRYDLSSYENMMYRRRRSSIDNNNLPTKLKAPECQQHDSSSEGTTRIVDGGIQRLRTGIRNRNIVLSLWRNLADHFRALCRCEFSE